MDIRMDWRTHWTTTIPHRWWWWPRAKTIQIFCLLQWSFSHAIKLCKTQNLGIGLKDPWHLLTLRTLLATNRTELGNHRFGKHRYCEPKASIQNNIEQTADNGYTTEDKYESPEQLIIMIITTNMYQVQIQPIIKLVTQHARYGQQCCISAMPSLTPWYSKFQVFQQTRGNPNFSKPTLSCLCLKISYDE